MFISGQLVSLLTFPGVVLHEWAHKFFCELVGLKVHEVVYFAAFESPSGSVVHEPPQSFKQAFFVAMGPLLINTLAGVLLGFLSRQTLDGTLLSWAMLWLGASFGMHAFPSNQDVDMLGRHVRSALASDGSFWLTAVVPLMALIKLANVLRFFWLDAIYAFMCLLGGMAAAGSFHSGL